ncbi:MAG: exodeoxyribonuclease V subunit gamma [Proteobacteria bacterium]|nr:exodeoxyribonuclease V subunit gamma [Pseudomonadota bacterium]
MPGLKIYTSNKLEILVQKLAQIVKAPACGSLSSSLSQEIIIVQSKAMERWLLMQIAKQNGVCANCRFPFPNAFLDYLIKSFFADIPGTNFFTPDIMTLKLVKMLPEFLDRTDFEGLKRYLKDDKSSLKLFEISEKIADLFDQYTVFRPDFIFSWENKKEENKINHKWQAILWQEIIKDNEKYHRPYLQKTLIEKLNAMALDSGKLFERVSVFGISSLPHFHMQLIEELANTVEINMFILNPCNQYWTDILTDKEAGKIKNKYATNIKEEYLHIEKGNSILSSLGELGKTFIEYMTSAEHILIEEFEDQKCIDILSCIQSDILNLKERNISDNHYKLKDPDHSIQFHSCHSQTREIEVLYDNLLSMFEDYPDILPDDILVMAPDIEVYTPFINAVFDNRDDDEPHIPFSISDRAIRKENEIIDGFLSILDLGKSRFEVSHVMAILEYPGIKENFGLVESELETIRGWLQDTRIRWGIDGAHKTALGLPEIFDNTWKSGIKRLLLGYTMCHKGAQHNDSMYMGILPFSEIEGSDANILGNFLEFLEKIFDLRKSLKGSQTIKKWHTLLSEIIDTFFTTNDEIQHGIQYIRKVLGDMLNNARLSGFDKELEFDIIKYYLRKKLENKYSVSGFKTKGITFCSMLPMRSIPFTVICILGMNNDAFPRSSYSYSFDLMASNPRPGDRSKKNDDKYLFLEGLISARKIFYLSYVGQSIQDNSLIPPSVIVSELLDYIKQGFGFTHDKMITSHKLQAFSPDYFKDASKLFSYSEDNMLAACSLNESRLTEKDNIPFISSKLSFPSDEWKIVHIDSLSTFFANPAKYLLQKRLGIYFEEADYALPDKEIFALTGIDNYLVNQNLLSDIQAGKSLDFCLSAYKSKGTLPHERIGDILLNESSIDAINFIKNTEAAKEGKILSSLELDITINNFSLIGRLNNCHDDGIINLRYAAMKAKDIIKSWIYHLALCSTYYNKKQLKSLLICMDKEVGFKHTSNSREILEKLLNLYWEGLLTPLNFFPDLSYDYVKQVHIGNKNTKAAIKDVCNKWEGGYNRMTSNDLYYKTCFGKTDSLDIFNDSFIKISESVFIPLLEHMSEF